ncbi:MAG: hypothetical protein ACI86M_002415 [Saprospiraceae bacterium]|jgi:hypothetical protein
MSDHTIIDTSTMTGKEKFSFRNLSSTQKGGMIGGGIALTAAFGAILSSLIGTDSPKEVEDANSDLAEDLTVNEAQDIDNDSSEEYYNDESVNPIEEETYSEAVDDTDIVEESYNLTFDTDIVFSNSVNNDMTFEDAFSSARDDVGYGGWFNWNGQSYSTFTKEEWSALSEEEQNSFVDEVVSHSDVENAQWVESQEEENEISSIDQQTNEQEYIISDEQIESEPEAVDNNDVESPIEADVMDDLSNSETGGDDLSEDIVIVKPIRGADVNGDGVVDALVFDNDGDGNIDLIALDEDYDGTFESYMINEDGDEDLDVFIIDEGGDGIDSSDSIEEISDVVNMENFVVLDDDQIPEDLSFIDDIYGDDDAQDDTIEEDLGFDDAGL